MDKLEKIKLEQDVINRLGKPEFDFDQSPLNESAKEIQRIRKAYASEMMKAKHQEKKQLIEQKEAEAIERKYKAYPAVPIELIDLDLQHFTDEEKGIIQTYFRNTNLTDSEIADLLKLTTQKVTALFRSARFQALAARLYEYLLPLKTRNAVLKAIEQGDKQIILRAAENTGIFKSQELNLNVNKPIEDAQLIERLKELGDKSVE